MTDRDLMFWDAYGISYNKPNKFIPNDLDLMFWDTHVGNQTDTTNKHSQVVEEHDEEYYTRNWEVHYMGNGRWRDIQNVSELSDTEQCHYFASQCGWDPDE